MDNTKLKPCPFCGGKAEFDNIGDHGEDFFMVCCDDCGASACFGDASETETGAAQAWNRRDDK